VADRKLLAGTYYAILSGFVRDGRALHYTDLAVTLGLRPEAARQAQQELLAALTGGDFAAAGGAHWAHPDTDYIASFSPFSNLATQYPISIDGQQKWYGQ